MLFRSEPAPPRRAVDVERIVAWRRAEGQQCRVALALVCGTDVVAPPHDDGERASATSAGRRAFEWRRFRRGAAIDMYGWSLLYHADTDRGRALVDPHDTFPDMPAWYESPLELADRAAFLAGRGIRSRALALVSRPEDFLDSCAGPVNRFFPAGAYRSPVDLRRLV